MITKREVVGAAVITTSLKYGKNLNVKLFIGLREMKRNLKRNDRITQ
jgi:hypothetical protein